MQKASLIIVCVLVLGGVCLHGVCAQDADYSSPEAAFRTYMAACEAQSFERADKCYTEEFQRFQKTDKKYRAHRHTGQLLNEYNYLHDRKYKLERHGRKAIMRFSPEFVRPAPLYFVKERGKWKIDGMFSLKNVKMDIDGRTWYWRDPDIDNEAKWLKQY